MGQEMKLAPIRLDSYQPLREVVAEALRDAIKSGTLAPGQRLMEIQLAEELGVSRTPVREAIRKLELEGYVVMMPRRGTYVANLSIRDVNDVFEIRTVSRRRLRSIERASTPSPRATCRARSRRRKPIWKRRSVRFF